MSLHPLEGARYLFELRDGASDGASASYDVTVFTPETATAYEARLSTDGDAELRPADAPVPEALEANLRAIARTLARAASKNLDADLPPWPRRVLRWRGPGRGR